MYLGHGAGDVLFHDLLYLSRLPAVFRWPGPQGCATPDALPQRRRSDSVPRRRARCVRHFESGRYVLTRMSSFASLAAHLRAYVRGLPVVMIAALVALVIVVLWGPADNRGLIAVIVLAVVALAV